MAIHGWLLVTSGLDEPSSLLGSPPPAPAPLCWPPLVLHLPPEAEFPRGSPALPTEMPTWVGNSTFCLRLSTEVLQARSVAAGGGGSSLSGGTFGHFLTTLFGRRYIPGERTGVNRCPISNSRGPVTTLPVKGDSGLL